MKLILVRHGETHWNREGRVQGVSDTELSEEGIKQACLLASALKHEPIEAIYTSPLRRALQTARIINEYHALEIQPHADLIEMNQGDFEGLLFKELLHEQKEFLKQWIARPGDVKMPNGESLIQLQDRAWRSVEKIVASGKISLVVSHSFTIAAILCRLSNTSLNEFRRVCVDTASKTVVYFKKNRVIVDPFNDRSHLFPAAEPNDR